MSLTAIYLDVSLLAPPEPMQQIIAKLPQLTKANFLQVKHSRKPVPLLAILDEQGYCWHFVCEQQGGLDSHWLWIWRPECSLARESLTAPNINKI